MAPRQALSTLEDAVNRQAFGHSAVGNAALECRIRDAGRGHRGAMNDVMPVVPLLDGGFAVIESAAGKDEYIAIYTFVRFDSEQAAEAWARDRRDDKAEESQRPRETIEAPHGGGPPFDDFWQDISTLAYMLDGEL